MKHTISNKHNLIIHHISDTHDQQHKSELIYPSDTDVIIHSGDATNFHDLARNSVEWEAFIEWYAALPISFKIYVPGNHDATCYLEQKRAKSMCEKNNIHYLNKDMVVIDGLKIWGDPTTPTFGTWYFTTDRSKTPKHWDMIPEDIDILITHGPRKGILDLSTTGGIHQCGDTALGRRIDSLSNLKLHCFGHIHDSSDAKNAGVMEKGGVFYSNAAAVKDNEFNKGIHYHGNTFLL